MLCTFDLDFGTAGIYSGNKLVGCICAKSLPELKQNMRKLGLRNRTEWHKLGEDTYMAKIRKNEYIKRIT